MKRRSKVSGASTKTRRPQAAKQSRSNVRKRVSHPNSPQIVEQMDTARREHDEAFEQLSAASEILKVINSRFFW
jgi:hypothetical protein